MSKSFYLKTQFIVTLECWNFGVLMLIYRLVQCQILSLLALYLLDILVTLIQVYQFLSQKSIFWLIRLDLIQNDIYYGARGLKISGNNLRSPKIISWKFQLSRTGTTDNMESKLLVIFFTFEFYQVFKIFIKLTKCFSSKEQLNVTLEGWNFQVMILGISRVFPKLFSSLALG